ncbi:FadR/GntR family transcriptional regulator [Enterococcus sp. DIV0187]|uniref:FadR/GntR family transcriptional regulator n=1 Tax=Enterococcus sp. DIV0187 TaxID=2774644 RepID=UPI003F20468E
MKKQDLLEKLVVTEIKTQSDYLADKIRNMIISGELDDNFKFPNEMEFSKKLNVSRTTLREAYKVLTTQGFIRITKHGTYVKSRADIAKQGDFVASLDLADKREMLEFVCALEPEAVALAAKKIDEEGLKKLKVLLLECEEAAHDSNELMEKNYQFHTYIREWAQNNLITSALAAYYDIFNDQIVEKIYSSNISIVEFRTNALAQHRELFSALKNGDSDKARKISFQHLLDDIRAHELRYR